LTPGRLRAPILRVEKEWRMAAEDNGTITRASRHPVSETLRRVEGALAARGFIVFCRIDHAAAASTIGEKLLPRTVILYGNPQIGTAAMARRPTLAIDLPAKLLVWQDEAGSVWITYNTARHFLGAVFARHGAEADVAAGGSYDTLMAEVVAHAVE
jgi:uncharacterized protein (DUF302 family)